MCVCVCVCISSDLESSVDRHLDCFHVSDVVNSATVNIVVHISFQIRVFTFSIHTHTHTHPGVGLLDHTLTLFLGFLSHIHSVLHSGYAEVHFHKSYRRDPFFHTLSSIYYLYNFDNSHSDQHDVIPCCDFDLHFSNNTTERLN